MPLLKNKLLGFVFVALLGVLPFFALAATSTSCDCYCGTEEAGAVQSGSRGSAAMCKSYCEDHKSMYVGCYQDPALYPENSDLCWTEEECEGWTTDYQNKTYKGTWGGQVAQCAKRPVSGAAMGYCYGPERPTPLGVPILGVTEVGSIGTYVNLVYRFMLPAASLIAVTMIMIAGLQWSVARGNTTSLGKAKQRMEKALVGMVLLLSAYVLLRMVDPRLVELGALKVPLIKEVAIIDPDSSCEILRDYGIVVSPTSGSCGNKGTIKDLTKVDPKYQNNNLKEGDTCLFIGCETGTGCVMDEGKGHCLACDSIFPSGLAPSASVCPAISTAADTLDKNADHRYDCFFDDTGINACVAVKSGSDPYVNCATLRSDVDPEDPCAVYEDIVISPADAVFSKSLSLSGYYEQAEALCESDFCGVAQRYGYSGCLFEAGSIVQEGFYNQCRTTGVQQETGSGSGSGSGMFESLTE